MHSTGWRSAHIGISIASAVCISISTAIFVSIAAAIGISVATTIELALTTTTSRITAASSAGGSCDADGAAPQQCAAELCVWRVWGRSVDRR